MLCYANLLDGPGRLLVQPDVEEGDELRVVERLHARLALLAQRLWGARPLPLLRSFPPLRPACRPCGVLVRG
jgi:hypothetical protein